jgi:hypothetical protein
MEPNPPPQTSNQTRTAPVAIWSLVLGILSLTCFWILAAIPAVICGHIAGAKIKRSGGTLAGSGLAVAGLVTGYISIALSLVMIPLLALALPNFVKVREAAMQRVCVSNLRQIDLAVETWALEHKSPDNAPVTFDDIQPYLRSQLFCPKGGTYKLGSVSEKPTCSIPGHQLAGNVPRPADASNSLSPDERKTLLKQLGAVQTAVNEWDYSTMIKHMHPAIFKLVPKDAFAEASRTEVEKFKQQGVKFKQSQFGEPTRLYQAGEETLCFVPRTSVIEQPGKRVLSTAYWVAIRTPGESGWRFLDGAGIEKNRNLLWLMFPQLPKDIEFPEWKQVVIP